MTAALRHTQNILANRKRRNYFTPVTTLCLNTQIVSLATTTKIQDPKKLPMQDLVFNQIYEVDLLTSSGLLLMLGLENLRAWTRRGYTITMIDIGAQSTINMNDP